MSARKVILGPSTFAEADPAPLDLLRGAGYEPVPNPYRRKLTKPELLDLLNRETVGLIAGLEPVDRDVLSRLKAVSRCGSGISNVDLQAARELGVAVSSTPDAPLESVAEMTVAALLALLRRLPEMDRELHAGRWSKSLGRELKGMTVAVVGFGRIGRRVAELLASFGTRLLVVDPALKSPPSEATLCPLDEALAQADIVTLHCSGEARLIGARELTRMKRGAFLLNGARGGLVEEAALVQALEEGRLAGAWLDVFHEEPYSGPLTRLPQVLLTPHACSYTRECRIRMERQAAENLLRDLAHASLNPA